MIADEMAGVNIMQISSRKRRSYIFQPTPPAQSGYRNENEKKLLDNDG